MSNALAIAGVTQVLRELVNDGLVSAQVAGLLGSSVTVTALPPDRSVTVSGGGDAARINVFLRQISPNLGWRNEGLPSRDGAGRSRLSNPPLALDLHYLISAHAAAELHAEVLLGHAVLQLHENGVITREAIRTLLQPPPSPNAMSQAVADCGLDSQIEQLRVSPEYLSTEESSKFWSATLSNYRLCAAYRVSVILMQNTEPSRTPLPVLERRLDAQPDLVPPAPTLEVVMPDGGQLAATLGSTIQLRGHHLGTGPNRKILLGNDRFAFQVELDEQGSGGEGLIAFELASSPAEQFPVGVYRVAARVPVGSDMVETNHLALVVAPKLTNLPLSLARVAGAVTIDVDFLPALRSGQSVQLVLGQRECQPDAFTTPATSLTFVVHDAPSGDHPVRLRIDGIESAIIDRTHGAPTFNGQRIQIT